MLSRLQKKYAGQPVRFLLFPSNQFGHQEPGSNAEIKAFANNLNVTLGPDSNVIMFAKSSLNHARCSASESARVACAPSSTTCCPTNDPVYEYLLNELDVINKAAPGTGKINWNFEKIVVDSSGKPLQTVLKGPDLDEALEVAISRAHLAIPLWGSGSSLPEPAAARSFLQRSSGASQPRKSG